MPQMEFALYDPALIFLPENHAFDEVKKDAFLEHLTQHLMVLSRYKFAQIYWSNELEQLLWENPQKYPWIDYHLLSALQIFHQYTHIIPAQNTPCAITPPLAYDAANMPAQDYFAKLVHTLLAQPHNCYFCAGLPNKTTANRHYQFSCTCHPYLLTPTVLNTAYDWFKHLDIVELFYPNSLAGFDNAIREAIDVARLIYFENNPILYPFSFTQSFTKTIVNLPHPYRLALLKALAQKLTFSFQQAAQSNLADEFIASRKEYRIRVTNRPTSTRIHYQLLSGNHIEFVAFYDKSEHDRAL